MELQVGDRVLCHKPIDGNNSIVGVSGTVIAVVPDRSLVGIRVPCIEFDIPISRGHSGGAYGDGVTGKKGHCWYAWQWKPDDGSLSLENGITAEERTRQAVLRKIKYLDEKFAKRQEQKAKEKEHAKGKTAAVQTIEHYSGAARYITWYLEA